MVFVVCIKDSIIYSIAVDYLRTYQSCMSSNIIEEIEYTAIGGQTIDLLAGGTDIGPLYVQSGN
jgi:hypothetical protein